LQSKASEIDRAAAIMRIADFRLEGPPETATDPKRPIELQIFQVYLCRMTTLYMLIADRMARELPLWCAGTWLMKKTAR